MCVPTAIPVESNVTVTGTLPAGAVAPESGLALSHGTSAGLTQLVFGSSAICQISAPVPVLPTLSVWLVVVFGSCDAVSAAGVTLAFGSPVPVGMQLCTFTSSTSQPVRPTELSEPIRQRNCTVCPA
ncbi:MAG: hypothetical protein BWX64_02790 [Acidobacteria bacterium ADurb.Bin051]|nr:MAG: hypothetical protein BWX64_02790 [Acidobacteria bacterium ADurb.Bin051]